MEINKKTEEKICVILPTYNRGESCIKVINNMIDQTINNWDLLIINDGSLLNHGTLIENHLDKIKDKRIFYYNNETNIKLPATLNVGIDKFLKGTWDYFTWISDDNIYLPNYLKNLYDLKADFAHSAWFLGQHCISAQYKTLDDVRRFHGLASYMWSRRAIELIGKYNPKYELVSDLEFLYKTYKSLCSYNNGDKKYKIEYKIEYSPKSEMIYVVHENADSVKHEHRMWLERSELDRTFSFS